MVAGGFLLGTLVEAEKIHIYIYIFLKKDMYDSKYNTSYVFLCKSDCGITYLVFAG